MLTQILATLTLSAEPICADALARLLGKDQLIVEMMLQDLEQRGRVKVVDGQTACEFCSTRVFCGTGVGSGPAYTAIAQVNNGA